MTNVVMTLDTLDEHGTKNGSVVVEFGIDNAIQPVNSVTRLRLATSGAGATTLDIRLPWREANVFQNDMGNIVLANKPPQ